MTAGNSEKGASRFSYTSDALHYSILLGVTEDSLRISKEVAEQFAG